MAIHPQRVRLTDGAARQDPKFQDVSKAQRALTEGDQWKTFFFIRLATRTRENCETLSEYSANLEAHPWNEDAMFSILSPRKHIPPHRGPYKGVLRYHLGLIIPGAEEVAESESETDPQLEGR